MQVPATERSCARFGPFEADLTSHELRHDGSKVKLQEMPFQILAILLEHPGQLVTREEFRQRLWPSDTFVDFEHSINTAVKKLREALADDPDQPRYIETLPKLGYRFIAPVTQTLIEPQGTAPQVQSHLNQSPQTSQRRNRVLRYAALIGAVLLTGVLLVAVNVGGVRDRLWRQRSIRPGLPIHIEALAVLPLQNLSQDPDQQYFADGLTDALITDLGKVSGLRVISRTSAMSYKQTSKPLPQIARELNVDAFVEGTVLRSGNQLRVTAQLVRASPEEHLWAERYERDVGEVIQLEKRLALAIAHEVTGHLTTDEEAALTSKRTTIPKAYDAYLRGRYLWNDRTAQAASGAGAFFEQALRDDPNFALAYSGLADYYTVSWGPWVNVPLGESYARKAVELQPDLAEAHASLGIAVQYQCKFAEAAKELSRAIALNPNYAMAHHWYAIHLRSLGRLQEALAENDRARRLDPFSLPINFQRTAILGDMREYDQAIGQAEFTSAIAPPSRNGVHIMLAAIYWRQGHIPEALAEQRKDTQLAPNPAPILRDLDAVAQAYASAGLRAALLKRVQLHERACRATPDVHAQPLEPCDSFAVAADYASLGDKGKTLYWLERGLKTSSASSGSLSWLPAALENAPEYDFLRSDPRFRALMRRMGLPK
jgi:TolB-like protein/DNA-binding winged helix-turn-helix (wHTH) protein